MSARVLGLSQGSVGVPEVGGSCPVGHQEMSLRGKWLLTLPTFIETPPTE